MTPEEIQVILENALRAISERDADESLRAILSDLDRIMAEPDFDPDLVGQVQSLQERVVSILGENN